MRRDGPAVGCASLSPVTACRPGGGGRSLRERGTGNDPLVLSHACALLTSSPQGAYDYIEAELREPDKILSGAAATSDFTRPVALLLGVLHHMPDTGRGA